MTTYTTVDGLAYNIVRSIAIDSEGNIWFGTWGGGVSKFDGKRWTTYTISEYTISDKVISFILYQNYPNPFNSETIIRYQLPKRTHVTLKIYNQIGQEVITLTDSNKNEGYYHDKWNGRNRDGKMVSSGIYFYRLKAGDFVQTRKMILLR